MMLHVENGHLWSNVVTQICLAWFAVCGKNRNFILTQIEIAAVYLCAGFAGGFAFIVRSSEESDAVSLVGASAGAFGLAGYCLFDAFFEVCRILFRSAENFSPSKWSLLCAKTLCAGLVAAIDVIALCSGDIDDSRRESIAVHLSGLGAGFILGFIARLVGIIYCLLN